MNFIKLIFILIFYLTLGSVNGYAVQKNLQDKKSTLDLHPKEDIWELGGQLLYLQQKYISYVPNRIKTFYDKGFELLGRYQAEDGRFFYINWYHYKDKRDNLTMPINDFQNEGPIELHYDYNSKFNFISVEIGGDIYKSKYMKVDFHAGAFLARTDLKQNLLFLSNITGSIENPYFDIRYNGIGPVLGLDIYYNIYALFQAYILSEVPIMIRRGYYNSNAVSVDVNQVTTVPATKVKVKGAMEGLLLEVGGLYKLTRIAQNIQLRGGWTSIHINEFETQWSGPFFGAKWVGDL